MRERKIIINKIIGGEIASIKDLKKLFQSIKNQPINDQQLLKIKVNIWRSPDNLKNYILLRRENSELFGALFLRRSTLASGHSTFFNGLFSGFEVKASDPLDLAFYESVNVSGKYLLAWLDFLNHRKVDSIISSDKKLLLLKMGDRSWLQSQLEPQLKLLLESQLQQLQRLQQLKLPLESQIQLQVLTSTLEKELEKLEKEGGILNRYENFPFSWLPSWLCRIEKIAGSSSKNRWHFVFNRGSA